MLLAVAKPAAPGENVQEELVGALIEGSKLQPLLQISKNLGVRNAVGEALQQCGVIGAEAASLRHKPAAEGRAAIDLQTFKEVSGERCGKHSQPIRSERLDALLTRTADLDRIDPAVGEIEPDRIGSCFDPSPTRLIDKAPDLAEAPAKFAPRIVGEVPQQLTKLAPCHGVRGERHIREEPLYLARCRQRQGDVTATDRQRPKKAHLQQGNPVGSVRPIRFHGHFHAGSHARLHEWPLP